MRALLVLLAVTALNVPPAAAATVPPSPDQKAILQKLAEEVLVHPGVPTDMPNPARWDGIYGRWTAGLSHMKTAREKGYPLAIFLVAERICPDTDDGWCYVSILMEFSARLDEEREEIDNIFRYTVLSSDGKRTSGCALNHMDGVSETDTFWVRRDSTWLHHAPDSPEHVVTKRLITILARLISQTDPRAKEPPPPATGTIADNGLRP